MSRILFAVVLLLAAGAGPATKPADKPADPKPFAKVEDVLSKLPKEARLERGEWNEFNTPKANERLKGILEGQEIETALPLDEAQVEDSVKDKNNPDKVLRWNVTATILDSPIRFDGVPGKLKVVTSGGGPFYMYTDEKTARAAKAWKRGDKVALRIIHATLKVETRDATSDEGGRKRENVYTLSAGAYYIKQIGSTKIPPLQLTPEEKEKFEQQNQPN